MTTSKLFSRKVAWFNLFPCRHDVRYYKGKYLEKVLDDRHREMQKDERDRQREKKELEELKEKLNQEGHPDPESEVGNQLDAKAASADISNRIKMLMNASKDDESNAESSNVKTFGFAGMKIAANNEAPGPSNGSSNFPVPQDQFKNSTLPAQKENKRKKLVISDVFNSIEDDEATLQSKKKRRLPPNLLMEDSNTDSNLSASSSRPSHLSQEDKKQQIKNLIDKIPMAMNELFAYTIDWSFLESVCNHVLCFNCSIVSSFSF